MSVCRRDGPRELAVTAEWDGGFSWLAHPNDDGRRVSHAIRADDGIWLVDPLSAPGLDERLAALGPVAGVAVLSNWHTRDADEIAKRHGVPVSLPTWVDRVENAIETDVVRYETELADSGLQIRRHEPFWGWREAFAYHDSTGTLVIPDSLGTAPSYTVGDERIGVELSQRLFPPEDVLGSVEPDRILVGHGTGVFQEATLALRDALSNARRRAPRAFLQNTGTKLRALLEAFRR
ncbi:hypothetical protein ACFQJC_08365 [Haloferax namakaokahaiae]|uniref:MBL fold metallo-hydrolase n=1 Tax=Haloferax namakaokahaiae TaxID=1748331 RepID=A0ABD5ZEK3_9EURY